MNKEKKLAYRYAQACWRIWGARIDRTAYAELFTLQQLFCNKAQALFFLKLPHIAVQEKLRIVDLITKNKTIALLITQLLTLLVAHKRAHLLGLVLRYMCELYKKYNHIMNFTFSSSHQLSKEQINALHNFIVRKTGHTIEYDVTLNKNLIAGIRLQSDTLLWEYSIRKQLASVTNCVIR